MLSHTKNSFCSGAIPVDSPQLLQWFQLCLGIIGRDLTACSAQGLPAGVLGFKWRGFGMQEDKSAIFSHLPVHDEHKQPCCPIACAHLTDPVCTWPQALHDTSGSLTQHCASSVCMCGAFEVLEQTAGLGDISVRQENLPGSSCLPWAGGPWTSPSLALSKANNFGKVLVFENAHCQPL